MTTGALGLNSGSLQSISLLLKKSTGVKMAYFASSQLNDEKNVLRITISKFQPTKPHFLSPKQNQN